MTDKKPDYYWQIRQVLRDEEVVAGGIDCAYMLREVDGRIDYGIKIFGDEVTANEVAEKQRLLHGSGIAPEVLHDVLLFTQRDKFNIDRDVWAFPTEHCEHLLHHVSRSGKYAWWTLPNWQQPFEEFVEKLASLQEFDYFFDFHKENIAVKDGKLLLIDMGCLLRSGDCGWFDEDDEEPCLLIRDSHEAGYPVFQQEETVWPLH